MTRILVVGANTVAGANVATRFADEHDTWTTSPVPGCRQVGNESDAPLETLAALDVPPDWIVVASTAGVWGGRPAAGSSLVARNWAEAAAAAEIDFCLLSTDAVFDGPRLFHTEVGTLGSSPEARAAQRVEESVLAACPTALVARASVFGWSPDGRGGIESQISATGRGRVSEGPHCGTPLHAAALAELLLAAREAGLRGVWHAGGAERIDQRDFLRRLAVAMETAWKPWTAATEDAPRETSLCSTRLAAAIDRSLPMIDEGLRRLVEEDENGTREALLAGASVHEPLVA